MAVIAAAVSAAVSSATVALAVTVTSLTIFFVLVLLSALVKRFSVSRMRDFSNQERKKNMIMHTKKISLFLSL